MIFLSFANVHTECCHAIFSVNYLRQLMTHKRKSVLQWLAGFFKPFRLAPIFSKDRM